MRAEEGPREMTLWTPGQAVVFLDRLQEAERLFLEDAWPETGHAP